MLLSWHCDVSSARRLERTMNGSEMIYLLVTKEYLA